MRIAIIGKGGSGKSSISWLLAKYLSSSGTKVLAIDADYNMDLAHNLGVDLKAVNFLKRSEADLYSHFDMDMSRNAFDITETHSKETFTTTDDFTKKYSINAGKNLQLMVLGDHDEHMLYSGRCSHAYAKSIKFYLPYLSLKAGEAVIADSVAGTDMVNYGLYLGADVIVCVVEDSKNSVGVMESSKSLACELGIPFFAVLNKHTGTDPKYMPKDQAIAKFKFDPALASYSYKDVSSENIDACKKLVDFLVANIKIENTIPRLVAWRKKHKQLAE